MIIALQLPAVALHQPALAQAHSDQDWKTACRLMAANTCGDSRCPPALNKKEDRLSQAGQVPSIAKCTLKNTEAHQNGMIRPHEWAQKPCEFKQLQPKNLAPNPKVPMVLARVKAVT